MVYSGANICLFCVYRFSNYKFRSVTTGTTLDTELSHCSWILGGINLAILYSQNVANAKLANEPPKMGSH